MKRAEKPPANVPHVASNPLTEPLRKLPVDRRLTSPCTATGRVPIGWLRRQGLVPAVIKTKSSLTSNATRCRLPPAGCREPRSRSAGFWVGCAGRLPGFQEMIVARRFVPAIRVACRLGAGRGLRPGQYRRGQDAGAHLVERLRGLPQNHARAGQWQGQLRAWRRFSAEHYTSSHEEAAALAEYVLSGGGGVGTPAPVRREKLERPTAGAGRPGTSGQARRDEARGAGRAGGQAQAAVPAEPGRVAARGAKPEPGGREAGSSRHRRPP